MTFSHSALLAGIPDTVIEASPDLRAGCLLSTCGTYRYALWRVWDDGPMFSASGINPSTAKAWDPVLQKVIDDATTRKLIGFGKRWGTGGYWLWNPFALRSRDQDRLLYNEPGTFGPVGPANDEVIARIFEVSSSVLIACGSAKNMRVRKLLDARLLALRPLLESKPLHCLGLTKDGYPCHPLMLAYSTPLEPWTLRQ